MATKHLPDPRRRARKTPRPGEAANDRVISASAAAKNFGALVDRVRDEHTVYIVERSGTPVALIAPVERVQRATLADLAGVLATGPSADAAFLDAVEREMTAANRPTVPEDRWDS